MTYVNTNIQDYQASNITTETLDVINLEADLILGVLQGSVIDTQNRILINHEDSTIFAPNGFYGDLTGNADTVTNGVYTIGDQLISGVKTFANQSVFNQSVNVNTIKNKSGYTAITLSDTGTGTPTTTIHGDLIVLSSSLTSVQTNDLEVRDHRILLGDGNQTSSPLAGSGIVIDGGTGQDIEFAFNSNQRMGLNYGLDIENGSLNVLDGDASVSGAINSNTLAVANSITADTVKANLLKSDGVTLYNASSDSLNTTDITAVTISGDLTGDVTGQVSDISNHTSDQLAEGSANLYYTDTRAQNAISSGLGVNYDSATGVISLDQSLSPTDSVQFKKVYVREGVGVGVDLTSQTNNASLRFHTSPGQTGIISTTSGNAPLQIYSSLLWSRAINGGTGDFMADGNSTVGGNSTVTGNASVGGDLDVVGAITSPTITALQNSQASSNAQLQAELDATQTGAGLNTDGSYSANTGANYIQASSSLQDADNDLDTALKAEEASRESADSTLQANIDTEEASRITGDANTLSSANAYTDTEIANLVASAPATLDTLNEIATALGNDPNLATTLTNSIATKLAIADFDSTFDTRLATKTTTDLTEGANLYYLDSRARASISVSGSLAYNANTGEISYTERTEGELNTISDTWLATKTTADLAEGVNRYFTTARARESISATGDVSYDDATGIISFTERTDTEVQSLADGQIAVASIGDLADIDLSANADGKILKYNSTSGTFVCVVDEDNFANNNTDQLAEGSTNLYYTDARSRSAISVSGSLSYDNANGIISFTQRTDAQVRTLADEQIALQVGSNLDLSQKSTSDLAEGSNLYYTDARARLAVSVSGDLNYDNATGIISFTERTDSEVNALADARIANASVGAMSDVDLTGIQTGQILKWDGSKLAPGTDQEDLSNNSTDDLSEGSSNLYYTDTRVGNYLTANGYALQTSVDTVQSNLDAEISDRDLYFINENNTTKVLNPLRSSSITIGNNIGITPAVGFATQFNRNVEFDNNSKIYKGGVELLPTFAELNFVDGVTSNIQTQLDGLSADITSEESARTSADATLQSNIDAEETARISGDATTLSSAQSYTDTAIANLVDSAPTTLDTLNELASALGDDPNFATTITTSIGTKLATADFDSTFDTRLATKTTDNVTEGSTNLYFTDARSRVSISAGGDLSYNSTTGVVSFTERTDAEVNSLADARIALNTGANLDLSSKTTTDLAEGTNLYYTDARVDARIAVASVTDLSDVDQSLATTDAVSFEKVTINQAGTDNGMVINQNHANAGLHIDATSNGLTIDSADTTFGGVMFRAFNGNSTGVTVGTDGNTTFSGNVTAQGTILLSGAPTSTGHAVPKSYVDAIGNDVDDLVALSGVAAGSLNLGTFTGSTIQDNINVKQALQQIETALEANTSPADTDDLSEGTTNLYYTDARARGAISVSGDLAYNSTTGVISFTERTDAEVNSLADARIALNTGANLDLSGKSTTDLSEGTNLYYTDARVDARIALQTGANLDLSSKTTDNLGEGASNLYYKDSRARGAISVSGDLAYNNTTGVISFTERTDAQVNGLADARIAAASIDDLSDVTVSALATTGDLLRYNKSTGIWENVEITGTTNIEVEHQASSIVIKHGTSHVSKTYDNADNGTSTNDLPIDKAEVILDIAGTATSDVYLNLPTGSEGQELVLVIDSSFSSLYNIYIERTGGSTNPTNIYGTISLGSYSRTAVLRYCDSLSLWVLVGGDAYSSYS